MQTDWRLKCKLYKTLKNSKKSKVTCEFVKIWLYQWLHTFFLNVEPPLYTSLWIFMIEIIRSVPENSLSSSSVLHINMFILNLVCMILNDFREEFHLQILKAFVDLHEFSDLNLVQALRWVMSNLLLFFFPLLHHANCSKVEQKCRRK